jgi:hypothetical protein
MKDVLFIIFILVEKHPNTVLLTLKNKWINSKRKKIIKFNRFKIDYWNAKMFKQKRFYNRETNSMAFCVIKQTSIKPPFPSMKLK